MNPNSNLCKVDVYPDANFYGMYGHDKPTDPARFKSLTGFIVTFADCPFLWVSKLQTDTDISNMEA